MTPRQLQRLTAILLLAVLMVGCTGAANAPAPTTTSAPPTDTPTAIPPTETSTATATPVPPTNTSTSTATQVPPTHTSTVEPTKSPTTTPTRTVAPKPTKTKSPAPTSKPAATQAPPPSNVTSVTVHNTFPMACRIVLWGPAQITIDAGTDDTVTRQIGPGTYGWRAFIGGAETGEAGNLEITKGSTCLFVCDKDKLAIRYGCR